MDFWQISQFMWHTPIANTYIPVRNTIMKKPNVLDEDVEDDEFGYQYNNYDAKNLTRQKLHPFEQLSPLRPNRMGPGYPRLTDHYSLKQGSSERPKIRYARWRRLSRQMKKNFSTINYLGGSSTDVVGVNLPQKLFQFPDLKTAFSNPFRQQ